jgi:signal transduction histidine kinase/DNA-binding NarL/FixJ family response regulator
MDRKRKRSEKERVQAGIESFRKLIADREDWLMERTLRYAKEYGYVKYTSTLREAWRLSISGLSAALLTAIQEDHPHLELGPDDEFMGDPIAEFGILEARRHRERGVSLGMFLGLMKYYRQSYKDMVRHGGFNPFLKNYCLNLIERFFDRIEIAFCIEWAESDQSKLIEDLQARNRLMTNEKNRYLTIFESHPHMVFILDKDRRLLNLNHAAARRFQAQDTPGAHYYRPSLDKHTDGYQTRDPQHPEPNGSDCFALKELMPSLADDLESFIAGGDMSLSFEMKATDHDEAQYYNVTFSQVLDVSEKFSGMVVVLEEITAQKHVTEELRRARDAADAANRAKSEFLANMSHELRTPLNAILGYSQLMQRAPSLPPEYREYLNTINRSGEHLLGLINEVLEISKIEARRITLDPRTFDLHAMLRDLHAMFKARTNDKSLSFELSEIRDLPHYVVTDESKFRQVLINLLGNAVKFTDKGGITVRVTARAENSEKICLLVEVEDTGPGIAEDELDMVFQYFEQTAAGRKSQSGTGLGMAISRNYARMMGGDITVTSRVGEGSTFRFESDLKEGRESDLGEKARERRVIGLAPGQVVPRVLVVEDNEEGRTFLVNLLELVGFNAREAENGEKAVELFEKYSPHFIWMDIRMPVMDGLEATRRIKAAPGGDSVKIAALTASVMEEECESILAAGCDDFVRKPCQESVLFEVMARHLGLKYLYDENLDETSTESETDLSSLAALPSDLHGELLDAVLELNTARTLEVVERIAQQDAALGTVLKKLAEKLEYDRLLTLLEKGSSGGQAQNNHLDLATA